MTPDPIVAEAPAPADRIRWRSVAAALLLAVGGIVLMGAVPALKWPLVAVAFMAVVVLMAAGRRERRTATVPAEPGE